MQYQKEIAQTEEYDVVVCGAGVAGFAAAVQSARLGARTALLERYGMPGGVLTVGGNNEIGCFIGAAVRLSPVSAGNWYSG